MLIEDEIEGEFVRGGNGGMFVLDDAGTPFTAAALRLELLLVLVRAKFWRLGSGTVLVCCTVHCLEMGIGTERSLCCL